MRNALSFDGQLIRRAVVVLTALTWLLMIATFPRSLDGLGMPLTLCLVALDVVLGALTGWLAFARSASLDERQAALRDRAYRVAFRLVLVGVLLMIVALFIGSIADSYNGIQFQPQPQPVLGARWIVGLLEVLIALPTAVIAWLQPEPVDENPITTRGGRRVLPWVPMLAIPALAALWLLAVGTLPVRASATRDDSRHDFSMANATCGHFSGGQEAGYGFGAQVRLDVEACWDGRHAFAFREDPMTDLTRCEVPAGTADFARVTHLSCTERTDASGTMFYTVRAKIESGLTSRVTRDVVMELVVTRDGRVLTFG